MVDMDKFMADLNTMSSAPEGGGIISIVAKLIVDAEPTATLELSARGIFLLQDLATIHAEEARAKKREARAKKREASAETSFSGGTLAGFWRKVRDIFTKSGW